MFDGCIFADCLSRGEDEDTPMSTFEEELALLESEESELITSEDPLQPVSFLTVCVLLQVPLCTCIGAIVDVAGNLTA